MSTPPPTIGDHAQPLPGLTLIPEPQGRPEHRGHGGSSCGGCLVYVCGALLACVLLAAFLIWRTADQREHYAPLVAAGDFRGCSLSHNQRYLFLYSSGLTSPSLIDLQTSTVLTMTLSQYAVGYAGLWLSNEQYFFYDSALLRDDAAPSGITSGAGLLVNVPQQLTTEIHQLPVEQQQQIVESARQEELLRSSGSGISRRRQLSWNGTSVTDENNNTLIDFRNANTIPNPCTNGWKEGVGLYFVSDEQRLIFRRFDSGPVRLLRLNPAPWSLGWQLPAALLGVVLLGIYRWRRSSARLRRANRPRR